MKIVLFSYVDDNLIVRDVKNKIYHILYEMRNDIYFYKYDNNRGDIFRGMPVSERKEEKQIYSYTHAQLFEKRCVSSQVAGNYKSRIYKPQMYLQTKYRSYSVYYGVHTDSHFITNNKYGLHFIKGSYNFPNEKLEETLFCCIKLDDIEIDLVCLTLFHKKYTSNAIYFKDNVVSVKYRRNAKVYDLRVLLLELYPNMNIYSFGMFLIDFHD
jgi:hypothetical protein